ncbi:MAG: hypothetical protein M1838_000693 [Thelocarpon superellum]|nr:MAG: hypothetical protein M1838_000693 [Thelocarpon superellum]
MVGRSKRRRVDDGKGSALNAAAAPHAPTVFGDVPLAPATREDQKTWKGFCEIESEPAFFNVMLRTLGVEGLKVLEVYGMDEEPLAMMPKPVHGLVFLFPWKEEDADKQELSCPDAVWFANQTSSNACASVALLNIVNNIPGAKLGEHLTQFKNFTRDFPPALRGDQVGNFDFLKSVHNSFARKMDMLNGDLALKNEAMASKKKSRGGAANDDEAGFHFIAFVPIGGVVWQLDGLARQPRRLGSFEGDDWLKVACPVIREMMDQPRKREQDIQFSLFAVVQDPIVALRQEMAETLRIHRVVRGLLGHLNPEEVAPGPGLTALGLADEQGGAICGLTEADIAEAEAKGVEEAMAAAERKDAAELRRVATDQAKYLPALASQIREEMASQQADDDRANARRHDYTPMVREWLTMLADHGVLRGLLEKHGV